MVAVASSLSCVSSGWFYPTGLNRRWRQLQIHAMASGDVWSSRGSKRYEQNYAVVGSWRDPSEPEISYEVDRKVVIGRLPRDADAAYLRELLVDAFGPVKYVEINQDDVAYVVFEEPKDAAAACRTSIRVRQGDYEVTIDCDRFEPRIDRRHATLTVFVGNLPYQGVTNDLLSRVFTQAGCEAPVAVRRPYPGIAYVEFGHQADADRAVRLAGTRVLGRAIRVDWDTTTKQPKRHESPRLAAQNRTSSQQRQQQPPHRSVGRSNSTHESFGVAADRVDIPDQMARGKEQNNVASVKAPTEVAKQSDEVPQNSTARQVDDSRLLEPPPTSAEVVSPRQPAAQFEREKHRSGGVRNGGNVSSLAARQAQTLETTSIKAARAAALSAAAAWREARLLREENADLRSKVPRRATWQPEPFALRLGSQARPGDILRLRIDGARDLELCVPPGAGPGALLVVRGALQCVVPRGAFPGEALAVPLPHRGDETNLAIIIVPPGKRPGSWLWVAYPVECVEPPNALPSPQNAVILPPPPRPDKKPPFLLAPPSTLAVRPSESSEAIDNLRTENEQLKRELATLRKLLKTTSLLLQDRLDKQISKYLDDDDAEIDSESQADRSSSTESKAETAGALAAETNSTRSSREKQVVTAVGSRRRRPS